MSSDILLNPQCFNSQKALGKSRLKLTGVQIKVRISFTLFDIYLVIIFLSKSLTFLVVELFRRKHTSGFCLFVINEIQQHVLVTIRRDFFHM